MSEPPPRCPRPPVVPANYRLSKESWAEIVEAYRDGATARALAVKWKVAPGSVYYHASKAGWSKKENGDDRARAHARAVEAAEAAQGEPLRTEQARLETLFEPGIALDEDDAAADPAALTRLATLASGRAMTGRLWSEAKALAGLAESYARLGEKAGGRGGDTIETIDLGLLLEIIVDRDGGASARFAKRMDGRPDPEEKIKNFYWDWQSWRHHSVANNVKALMMRALYAEKKLRALGGEPRITPNAVEIEAWVRDWLSGPPSEATIDRRNKLGEVPWY